MEVDSQQKYSNDEVVKAASEAPIRGKLMSTTGFVALLSDPNLNVKAKALNALLKHADSQWHEISEAMVEIESLAMDSNFSHRKVAALLASKLAYNLEMSEETLQYAMIAEDLFDVAESSQYTLTVLANAVKEYCERRKRLLSFAVASDSYSLEDIELILHEATYASTVNAQDLLDIDQRLELLVERLAEDSRKNDLKGEKETIGIALEARRLDMVRDTIIKSSQENRLLPFTLDKCLGMESKKIKNICFKLLSSICSDVIIVKYPHRLVGYYITFLRIFYESKNYDELAKMFHRLLTFDNYTQGSTEIDEQTSLCAAYQCAFDLVSFEDREFLEKLLEHPLLQLPAKKVERTNQKDDDAPKPDTSQMEDMVSATSQQGSTIVPPIEHDAKSSPLKTTDQKADIDEATETDRLLGSSNDEQKHEDEDTKHVNLTSASSNDPSTTNETERSYFTKLSTLRKILSRVASLELTVKHLHRKNRTDLELLDIIKGSIDPRSSILQNALVICHAFMQAGTTCDSFLRENLEWLGRAVCWAKFVVAASTGLLHKGHVSVSRQVLIAYLPGSGGDAYSGGGALFGLGLIHANLFDDNIKKYLLEQLQSCQTYFPQNYEPLQHGACLGLGLMAMTTADPEIYRALRDILFMDSAVSGEAAAIAMGLLHMGHFSHSVVLELLGHAQDTEHERIIRGASLGVAFVLFKAEQKADGFLDQLTRHKEKMIRYSGMFCMGLAYFATGSTSAVRFLLHVAVTDVSNDVRRAAVISIAFIMCEKPKNIIGIMGVLANSFNPHVRYGATLAVGIGFAGTSSVRAGHLLLPMTQDTVEFVRQGALLALGLIWKLNTGNTDTETDDKIREFIIRNVGDRREVSITRFHSIVAHGLLETGGGNSTLRLFSGSVLRIESVVGFVLFSQLWFWHPLILCLSLALQPQTLIGVTTDLTMPDDFVVPVPTSDLEVKSIICGSSNKEKDKKTKVSKLITSKERGRRDQLSRSNAGKLRLRSTLTDHHQNEGESGGTGPTDSKTRRKSNAVAEESAEGEGQEKEDSEPIKVTLALLRSTPDVIDEEEYDQPTTHIKINSPNWDLFDANRTQGIVLIKPKHQSNSSSSSVEKAANTEEPMDDVEPAPTITATAASAIS